MTGEQERIDKLTAAELLVTADRASHTMVSTGGSTRVVLLVYVLIGSTVLSLADVISGTAILWLAALIIPVLLVHFFPRVIESRLALCSMVQLSTAGIPLWR
ncbi:hypothetical protein [Glutamicibacter ardleyensis]|uniref:hypothetical protein n=1 Tax=Glutamicibacter ardleyensis TaxID=225894 RepID=UPI003FD522B6